MAQRTSREVLNHLIETCRDGERGFRSAADLATDPSLKTLFLELAAKRGGFAQELAPFAQRLGGATAAEGTTAASVHRRWMDIKSVLTSHDDHAVVTEVRRGNRLTLRIYREALEGVLPASVRDLVDRQAADLEAAQVRIDMAERERRTLTVL